MAFWPRLSGPLPHIGGRDVQAFLVAIPGCVLVLICVREWDTLSDDLAVCTASVGSCTDLFLCADLDTCRFSPDVIERFVVRCGSVWFGVVRCGSVWFGVVRCGSVWFGVVRCGSVWFGVGPCGSVWFGVVRCVVISTRPERV